MASIPRKTPQLEVPPPLPANRTKLTPSVTRTTSHRPPPPALFQGPPSKNDSHISLALPEDRPPGGESEMQPRLPPRPSHIPPASSFSGPSLQQPAQQPDDRRAENLWAEMQKTLADVELSAMNTSHVFGTSHARALESLRNAQLSLAQVWAKSEADDMDEHDFDLEAGDTNVSTLKTGAGPSPRGNEDEGKTTSFNNHKDLEEETERDIQLARKRREANDRYFQQVNRGVLDVVNKLDDVAAAMRRVERESRELWNESSDESSSTSGHSVDTHASGTTDSPVEARGDD